MKIMYKLQFVQHNSHASNPESIGICGNLPVAIGVHWTRCGGFWAAATKNLNSNSAPLLQESKIL